VDPEDVPSDAPVPFFVPDVPHDEYQVEAGKDGGHEVDVLGCGLQVVVAPEDGIGGGQNGGTGVEDGRDTRLREGRRKEGREGGREGGRAGARAW
jgi:hypothetical protein